MTYTIRGRGNAITARPLSNILQPMNPTSRFLWVGGRPYVSPSFSPFTKEQQTKALEAKPEKRHDAWARMKRERMERKAHDLEAEKAKATKLADTTTDNTDTPNREMGGGGTIKGEGIQTGESFPKPKAKRRTRRKS